MPRVGSAPPLTISPAIPIEVQRALQRTEGNVSRLGAKLADAQKQLAGKLGKSPADLLAVSGFLRNQLQSTGSTPLSISSLQGKAAQTQPASVPDFSQLPPNAEPGSLVVKNGQLYVFGGGGTGGVLGMWQTIVNAGSFVDTHANRIANFPAANYASGTLFFESDRTVLYVDVAGVWTFGAGVYSDVIANRPTDLATADAGFEFFATDTGALYFWDGAAWLGISGGSASILGIRTITASDSVASDDYTILSDATAGAIVVTFPPTPATGRGLNNAKIDLTANTLTLDGNGLLIGGFDQILITDGGTNVETQFDGTEWELL